MYKEIKTESIRKLSNFNFQWTKTLYQNNLKHTAFLFTLFNQLFVITPKTIFYGSLRNQSQIAQNEIFTNEILPLFSQFL